MARTAEVKRDALIGRATAQMETTIKQSLANEELTKSKLDNETQVRLTQWYTPTPSPKTPVVILSK